MRLRQIWILFTAIPNRIAINLFISFIKKCYDSLRCASDFDPNSYWDCVAFIGVQLRSICYGCPNNSSEIKPIHEGKKWSATSFRIASNDQTFNCEGRPAPHLKLNVRAIHNKEPDATCDPINARYTVQWM